eukprot:1236784-Pleurochrysis_carterae.AAC.1
MPSHRHVRIPYPVPPSLRQHATRQPPTLPTRRTPQAKRLADNAHASSEDSAPIRSVRRTPPCYSLHAVTDHLTPFPTASAATVARLLRRLSTPIPALASKQWPKTPTNGRLRSAPRLPIMLPTEAGP